MIDRTKLKGTLIEVIYKDIVTSEFNDLEKYLSEHFENHNERKSNLDLLIKENVDSDFIDFIIDDFNEYDSFDQILYSSQIVIIYSRLEFWLSKIAKKLEHRTNSIVKLSDLKESSDLDKARKYIIKYGQIDLEKLNELWSEIKEFRTIRNLIVHNGYNLFKHQIIKNNEDAFTEKEKLALRIINKTERLSIDLRTGIIKISDLNYPLRFCSICQTFLHDVLDKIIKKYNN